MACGSSRRPWPWTRTDRNGAAIVSAACDAIQCFLVIFELGAQRHLPDPEDEITRLRGQLEALLTPRQSSEDAARHALKRPAWPGIRPRGCCRG